MRLLKAGGTENLKNWKGYVTCDKKNEHDGKGCGTVMEIEERDLGLMYWEDASSQHYYVAVRCPECGKHNIVRNVPNSILVRMVDSMNRGGSRFDGYSRET
ncbi:MAG: hypothetical protein NTW68_13005 [candidate division NC10 bacterium]|nr:hypothetical protein [candidate division NC10 bacterium]